MQLLGRTTSVGSYGGRVIQPLCRPARQLAVHATSRLSPRPAVLQPTTAAPLYMAKPAVAITDCLLDHSALYHLIQAAALGLLFMGVGRLLDLDHQLLPPVAGLPRMAQ